MVLCHVSQLYPFSFTEAAIHLASKIETSCQTQFFEHAQRARVVFQPITFARFDNESVNHGLLVLELTRGLDP